MTPGEVRSLSVAEYLALLRYMDEDFRERKRAQRAAARKRGR